MSPFVSHAPEKIGRYYLEDLEIGMRAEFERQVTEPMGEEFADVTGDRTRCTSIRIMRAERFSKTVSFTG